jgi:hypothetical protein
MALGSTQTLTEVSIFPGGVKTAGADCLEIWEPQPPGTLYACNSPERGFPYFYLYHFCFECMQLKIGEIKLNIGSLHVEGVWGEWK